MLPSTSIKQTRSYHLSFIIGMLFLQLLQVYRHILYGVVKLIWSWDIRFTLLSLSFFCCCRKTIYHMILNFHCILQLEFQNVFYIKLNILWFLYFLQSSGLNSKLPHTDTSDTWHEHVQTCNHFLCVSTQIFYRTTLSF